MILYELLLLINDAFAISEIAMLLGPSPFVCAIRVSEALLIYASISYVVVCVSERERERARDKERVRGVFERALEKGQGQT